MATTYPQAQPHDLDDFENVPTSPHAKDFTTERKKSLVDLLRKKEGGVLILKFHQSLCPKCVEGQKWETMKADSVVYVKDNKVWMIKQCPKHGAVKDLYYGDWNIYQRIEKYQDPGIRILNPEITKKESDINCPVDCGLCLEHESQTALGNIAVTNRCDLTCWYCFFFAKENEPIYEPTLDQIREMLQRMRDKKPVGANAVQLTGGEPTLRDDIIDIIKTAKEVGYDHVQLNTNGINLAQKPGLTQAIAAAGSHTLYMSFDGLTPVTNPKNYWEAPRALENCHKAGIGVVLVPTVIGGINDHELGDIIRLAAGNIHVVRSVNFQPVSLVGRMPDSMRKKQRITIPGTIRRIEEQTNGEITKDDFFPIPCVKNISDFIEMIKQKPKYRLSTHFLCGQATYVFKDEDRDNRLVPLPQFFDVNGFFEYLGSLTDELSRSKHKSIKKAIVLTRLTKKINSFVNEDKKPKKLNFVRMLLGTLKGGDFGGMADFHSNSLFIGMMHFQDPYNWDIDRIHKCNIHYATPDGRVLPFCTFNVIPELYRDRVQREYSMPAREWEKKTGKKLRDDRYQRQLTPEEMRKIKTFYEKYRIYSRNVEKGSLEPDWGWEEAEKLKRAS